MCGMMVDPATARGGSHVHKENTYYFCNPRCRERFAADPEKYLDPAYKPGGMSGMVQLGGISPQQTQQQPPGTPIALAPKPATPATAADAPLLHDKPAENAIPWRPNLPHRRKGFIPVRWTPR